MVLEVQGLGASSGNDLFAGRVPSQHRVVEHSVLVCFCLVSVPFLIKLPVFNHGAPP
jgi:hypothetical protein